MPAVTLVELPDGRREFGWIEDGLPTFSFRNAPAGLATARQLRAMGLRPNGQDPVAQIKWWRKGSGWQWAGLYRIDRAAPKRTATERQRRAISRALAARRRCSRCGPVDHYVHTPQRLCSTCFLHTIEEVA
ncbi:hypothetical protein GCM10025787_38130 [Saccharopolyspora rosea]|uniref:RRQRL motif-containing zinc-binding protein n=1 Tax=Saccharopolyspora rosea TaxID=524884 RepID=A0ABW3FKP9_9PSEU